MESVRYVSFDLLALILTFGVCIIFFGFLAFMSWVYRMRRFIVNCYDLETGKLKKQIYFFTTKQVDSFIERNRKKYRFVVRDTLGVF